MILSMTGYGKSTAEYRGKKITAEIKSLNSKALDLSVRLASVYREKEMELRALIAQSLERGKVEFSLWVEVPAGAQECNINVPLMQAYHQHLSRAAQACGIAEPEDWLACLLRMPDVMSRTETAELTDDEWAVACTVAREAIGALVDFRRQEGAALQRKFTEKLDNIAALLAQIGPYEKSRVERIRQRIVDGLQAIPEVDYDKGRLEQEMIYYIEKLDISEEKQRLTNHLQYFRHTMEEEQKGQGKKLGFIAQEMGREINTTGSKSNQAEMQNIVVRMKDELEQIKEQVLNVM